MAEVREMGSSNCPSLASVECESTSPERDIEAYEWVIVGVKTQAVERLYLDWPQEKEVPKSLKLDDRFLSGGQGEGHQ